MQGVYTAPHIPGSGWKQYILSNHGIHTKWYRIILRSYKDDKYFVVYQSGDSWKQIGYVLPWNILSDINRDSGNEIVGTCLDRHEIFKCFSTYQELRTEVNNRAMIELL